MNYDNFYKEYLKDKASFKKEAKIKSCFLNELLNCDEKIIFAHSLQKNGILKKLEHPIKGQNLLYRFTDFGHNPEKNIYFLSTIGKSEASAFNGFCIKHDAMFAEIETHPFNNTNKEIFLHSYRGFAHTFHRKIEQVKGFSSDNLFKDILSPLPEKSLSGTKLGVTDGRRTKILLDDILINQEYEKNLESLIIEFPFEIDIATCAAFTPKFSPNGTKLNYHMNKDIPYEFVFITIFPDNLKSYAIISCLKNENKSIQYINELSMLSDFKIQKALSSILIGEVENVFLSPRLYNKFNQNELKELISGLTLTNPFTKRVKGLENFYWSKLNFFENKFHNKNHDH